MTLEQTAFKKIYDTKDKDKDKDKVNFSSKPHFGSEPQASKLGIVKRFPRLSTPPPRIGKKWRSGSGKVS
jgi:hypothetical protein